MVLELPDEKLQDEPLLPILMSDGPFANGQKYMVHWDSNAYNMEL